MSFWAYMLHCNGGYFYTGHTDNVEHRMAQHASGQFPGFVRDHWPAKLVWCAEFSTRYEALTAERQIKGWSRAKKLALVRGDWKRISELAASRKTALRQAQGERSSFESMRLPLIPHPSSPPQAIAAVEVEVTRPGPRILALRYRVTGDTASLLLPRTRPPERAGELWRHTCFEAFLANPPGYLEFNFSPSTLWGAYRFDGPRENMRNAAITAPKIETRIGFEMFELHAELAMPVLGPMGISAVIEEKSGTVSWWALAHPAEEPDFHHPDSFQLRLDPAH